MPIDELRSKLLDGLVPFDEFAAAVGKHPKTIMRLGPPLVRIGRDIYVPEERGRAWLLNGCKPVEIEKRGRRRPRAA